MAIGVHVTPQVQTSNTVRVRAMLLCDSVIQDKNTGKLTLVGLFDEVSAPSFPVAQRFGLLLKFTGLVGQHHVSFRVIKENTGEAIATSGTVEISSPTAETNLVIASNPSPVVLPEPGRYGIEFLIDGTLVDRIRLQASQTKG